MSKPGHSHANDPIDLARIGKMAAALRALSIDQVEAANSGHPGMPMGMADLAATLFARHLTFDPKHPDWPDRDRFFLSNGHGSALLYSLLHLTGYERPTLDDLRHFRQVGWPTAGHPEYGSLPGIETTTGPLGQGLGNAVGSALAERLLAEEFGEEIVDHRTFVFLGDGCLMEGIGQEAISLAGHWKLNRLVLIFDDNSITIDGKTNLSISDDICMRMQAAGFHVEALDGHDIAAIDAALTRSALADRPTFLACRTIIGRGAPTLAGTSKVHGSPLGADEATAAKKALGGDWPAFEVPEDHQALWQAAATRGLPVYQAWETRIASLPANQRDRFEKAMARLPSNVAAIDQAFQQVLETFATEQPKIATRQASQKVLDALQAIGGEGNGPAITRLLGGSADLTGSNNTRAAGAKVMDPSTRNGLQGRYIHYGVREHAMGAIMNGLALHGGFRPFGGTFLVFSDYLRGALRLSALSNLPVIHVLTHDSIGLGEDGPTHQPVEHLAALRAMPNLTVLRPAGAVEVAESWKFALKRQDGPIAIVLSRQAMIEHRSMDSIGRNLVEQGAYAVDASKGTDVASGELHVILIATGSEVQLAVVAAQMLANDGIVALVVSMPCPEFFFKQPQTARDVLIPPDCPKIVIEAAVRLGWDRILSEQDAFIGMSGFGESGKASDVYQHFGITVERIVETAKTLKT